MMTSPGLPLQRTQQPEDELKVSKTLKAKLGGLLRHSMGEKRPVIPVLEKLSSHPAPLAVHSLGQVEKLAKAVATCSLG